MGVLNLEIWPYILPLPSDRADQRRFLLSVFGSDAAIDTLKNVSLEGKVYQRDLIKNLKYSNKTIIKHLKTLVSFGVLEEGMESVLKNGKKLWLKWYKSTNLGKWLVLLFVSLERVNAKRIEKILEELFELYVGNAVRLCKAYDLSPRLLVRIFEKSMASPP